MTWESQRRNRELAEALDFRLVEMADIDAIRNPMLKYPYAAAVTIRVLRRLRPALLCCENPSLVLSLLGVVWKKLFRVPMCVDAHYAGLFPADGRCRILQLASRVVQRQADLVLVTTDDLKRQVEANGGRAFVLPDRIPQLPPATPRKLRGTQNVLYICSYAADEPYQQVFQSATQLPPDTFVYVTGDSTKAGISPKDLPHNVVLTGFIPEQEFVDLLAASDVVVDLTGRENCLLCGAYESLAAGKPLVLSDTAALRGYFSRGVVYTKHSADAIAGAIRTASSSREILAVEIAGLREQREAEWEDRRMRLLHIFHELVQKSCAA